MAAGRTRPRQALRGLSAPRQVPRGPAAPRPLHLIALAASFLAATACASPRRDECRALSTVVNATADRVEKAQASALDPSGLKAMADVLEKAAGEAEALKLTVPEIAKHAKDYAALQRNVAKTARDMAVAGEANDQPAAETANQAMEKLVANEPKLVADLNKLCSGE